jgi:hypothetical protein
MMQPLVSVIVASTVPVTSACAAVPVAIANIAHATDMHFTFIKLSTEATPRT